MTIKIGDVVKNRRIDEILPKVNKEKYGYANTTCLICNKNRRVRIDRLEGTQTTGCSCSCKRTHGYTNTREYSSWCHMRQRCYNLKHKNYKHYGGRGITICAEWRNSFEAFIEDMGSAPTQKHSLDRIDPNGNYELKNCRWATTKEQRRNQRNRSLVEWRGEKYFLADLCERYGQKLDTVSSRLIAGWSLEEALLTMIQKKYINKRFLKVAE